MDFTRVQPKLQGVFTIYFPMARTSRWMWTYCLLTLHGSSSRCFRNPIFIVPRAPSIPGITLVFVFHVRAISISRSLFLLNLSTSVRDTGIVGSCIRRWVEMSRKMIFAAIVRWTGISHVMTNSVLSPYSFIWLMFESTRSYEVHFLCVLSDVHMMRLVIVHWCARWVTQQCVLIWFGQRVPPVAKIFGICCRRLSMCIVGRIGNSEQTLYCHSQTLRFESNTWYPFKRILSRSTWFLLRSLKDWRWRGFDKILLLRSLPLATL